MVVSAKYNVIDMETGLLDRRIYTDEQIYQEELEKVFGRAWLFIGHESLVPNPNDFFLSYMGEDPVILTRDAKGQLHAFLNMCRHRGNRVVRADDGNAKNFMCTYHGWTYSNEGKLVSVPGLQEAYYGELDVDNLGLVPVARLETYAGIVFATWAQDAPSLEAYLGDRRWYMDLNYNSTDNGIQVIGPVKWIAPFNWKVPVDNASHDMYHGLTTHFSMYIVRTNFKGERNEHMRRPETRFKVAMRQVHAGNGHCMTVNLWNLPEGSIPRGLDNRPNPQYAEEIRAYQQAKREERIRRLGAYRVNNRVTGGGSVFPNMMLGMCLVHPRGPGKCEIWEFAEYDKDAPEAVRASVREGAVHGASQPGGLMMQDDMDNWRQVTDSGLYGRYGQLAHIRQNLSMGIRHEGKHPELHGVEVSHGPIAETGQRAYYARYQEFMNAESWANIHIDPITAKFEGTATMTG